MSFSKVSSAQTSKLSRRSPGMNGLNHERSGCRNMGLTNKEIS